MLCLIQQQGTMLTECVFGYQYLEEDIHSGYRLTFYGETKKLFLTYCTDIIFS